jgi:glycosyltransferase involved in cell wall biosynthesis
LPGFLAAFFLAAIRVARSSDVLFANWAISGAIGGIAARLVGIPLVTTIRGEDVMHVASSRLRGAILRLAVSRSRRVVTVSEAMADTLRGLFPEDREKIVHIANGVDFGRQRSVSNKASDGPLTMVTVGSLIPRKRVETIVDAMSRLNDVEDLRLVIVGDGEERPRLEQRVAELNLSARVSFTGMIPADAVPDILADADLFVLASESEGRPNVVLEAMANGLPVIGTKIPGVVELVEDGVQGATFEIGDTEGLAQAVRTLHDPNHRSRCGRAARSKIAEQNLTWEACAEAYSRLFDTLLAEV